MKDITRYKCIIVGTYTKLAYFVGNLYLFWLCCYLLTTHAAGCLIFLLPFYQCYSSNATTKRKKKKANDAGFFSVFSFLLLDGKKVFIYYMYNIVILEAYLK